MIHGVNPCEFPHSEISGSLAMCAYPKLIAAYHVLHRLLMPRHSPCALCSLTYLVIFYQNYYNSDLTKNSICKNTFFLGLLYQQFIFICNFQRTFYFEKLGFSKLNRIFLNLLLKKKSEFRIFYLPVNHLVNWILHRKEVIQPQVLLRLPCYDFTPIADPTLGRCLAYALAHELWVLPTLMVWRAVCTRPGNVFTATFWFAITSNSSFM